jgi:hypothetical protein
MVFGNLCGNTFFNGRKGLALNIQPGHKKSKQAKYLFQNEVFEEIQI